VYLKFLFPVPCMHVKKSLLFSMRFNSCVCWGGVCTTKLAANFFYLNNYHILSGHIHIYKIWFVSKIYYCLPVISNNV
jgi:hypothetical protein